MTCMSKLDNHLPKIRGATEDIPTADEHCLGVTRPDRPKLIRRFSANREQGTWTVPASCQQSVNVVSNFGKNGDRPLRAASQDSESAEHGLQLVNVAIEGLTVV
jgi:hypothetical protein